MTEIQNNTEQHILKIAEELFLEKGFSNTSTTEIAKRAGCNQTLIHYYYRTKENLFKQIFVQKIEIVFQLFMTPSNTDDFFENLENRINLYFNMFEQNPNLPFLILDELIINKERRKFIYKNFILNPSRQKMYNAFDLEIKNEIAKGTIRPIETLDLLLNIVSLTAFTFVILPIFGDLLAKNQTEQKEYIDQRKRETIELIISRLRPASKTS